jgi:hypothetical protein
MTRSDPELWLPDGSRPPDADPPVEEIADAEVVTDPPPAAPAPAPGAALVPAPAGPSTALIDAATPDEMIQRATAVATALDRIIADRGLRVNMGTRDKPRWHVEVEGWQTLGTLLGCVPRLEWARVWANPETGKPDRVRYTARVEHFKGRGNERRLERVTSYDVDGYSWEARVVIKRGDAPVGEGEALCSRKEVRWGRADDYAVKSMAITRATSRAYKQAAGWVVALAGYEATPAAEVDPHTGNPLPYGPDVDGNTAHRLRKAAAYLLDPGGLEGQDEALYEAVQDWITAVHGETNGYLPQIVARGVLLLARDAKKLNDDPTPED